MKKTILAVIILFAASTAYPQIPNTLSSEDKVFGLSKLWEEVNYNFVFMNRINRSAWDSTYKALITVVQKTQNDYEYYRELQKFCAMLHDGHTNVYYPHSIDSLIYNSMFGKYRMFLENIEDKAIVVRTNLSMKDEIPLGSEVIEVNGMSTRDYIDRFVAPYISSSTDYVLWDACVSRLLQGLKGDHYDVAIRTPAGEVKKFSLTHARTEEQEVYLPFEDHEILEFKWYGDKIAYVALNTFGDQKIDSLFEKLIPELDSAKGLIIDLRRNGGGNSGYGDVIMEHLTNDTLIMPERSASRIHIAVYKAWGRFTKAEDTVNNEWAKKSFLHFHDQAYFDLENTPDTNRLPPSERIVVPTVFLIGHNTASAAEDFVAAAYNQKHIIKIGENTTGSTGQPYMFDLPGGGGARICTRNTMFPDGKEFIGYGIKPDIEVKQTIKDHLEHNDVALKRAIEYLRGKIK